MPYILIIMNTLFAIIKKVAVPTVCFAVSTSVFSSSVELVSRNSSGSPGSENSGTGGVVLRAAQVTDDGDVFFLSSAPLSSMDTDIVVDPYHFSNGLIERVDSGFFPATGDCFLFSVDYGTTPWSFRRTSLDPTVMQEYRFSGGGRELYSTVSNPDGIDGSGYGGAGVYTAGGELFLRHFSDGDVTSLYAGSNGELTAPTVSADGNWIAFSSTDWEITDNDTNAVADVFLYSLEQETFTNLTAGLLHNPYGASDPDMSSDGSAVCFTVFTSGISSLHAKNYGQVYMYSNGKAELISCTSSGEAADGLSGQAAVNSSGRFVVFSSTASNLHSSSTGGKRMIYLRDTAVDRTWLISSGTSGIPADADCFSPELSFNGRYVTFISKATNLSGNTDGSHYQVYRADRGEDFVNYPPDVQDSQASGEKGNTVAIFPNASDADGDALSYSVVNNVAEGTLRTAQGVLIQTAVQYTASTLPWEYTPDSDDLQSDEFTFTASDGIVDSLTGTVFIEMFDPTMGLLENLTGVSEIGGDHSSDLFPGLDMDSSGERIVFATKRGLTATDTDSGRSDIYLYDVTENSYSLLSLDSSLLNAYLCSISGDGRVVAYFAQNNFSLILLNLETNEQTIVSELNSSLSVAPDLNYDGSCLVFETAGDVMVYDSAFGSLTNLTQEADADCLNPVISEDGRVVCFESASTNLVIPSPSAKAVYWYSLSENSVWAVSGNQGQWLADSSKPSVSASGRFVAFLGGEQSDSLYRKEIATGSVEVIATGVTGYPNLSTDGAFLSYTKNGQVYRYEQGKGVTVLISNSTGTPGNSLSKFPVLSGNGRFTVFASDASDLVNGDTNDERDIFISDFGNVSPEEKLLSCIFPTLDEDASMTSAQLSISGDFDVRLFFTKNYFFAGQFVFSGITPDRSVPQISYQPTVNFNGTDTAVVCLDDFTSISEYSIPIVVSPVNDAPIFVRSISGQTVNEGETLQLELTVSDPDWEMQNFNGADRDTISFSVISGPGSLSNSEYVYSPGYETATSENPTVAKTVQLQLMDSAGATAEKSFQVSVKNVNAPPVISNPVIGNETPTSSDDLTVTYTFTDIDGDAEGNHVFEWFFRDDESLFTKYALGNSSVSASETTRGQEWYCRITPEDSTGNAGTSTDSAVVEILNSPPVLVSDISWHTDEDSPVDGYITVSDYDSDSCSISVVQDGSGSFTPVNAGNEQVGFIYQPVLNFSGTDSVAVRIFDGTDFSTTYNLTFHIAAVDDPPVLSVSDSLFISDEEVSGEIHLDTDGSGHFSVTDFDTALSLLQFEVTDLSENCGTFIDSFDGVLEVGTLLTEADFPLSFLRSADSTGSDILSLRVSDSQSTSAPATLTVSAGAVETVYQLQQGWNLISIPVIPTVSDPAVAFVETNGTEPVYNGNIFRWNAVNGNYDTVEHLSSGSGYWVHCPTNVTVLLSGTPATQNPTTISVGWNLVGPVGTGSTCLMSNLNSEEVMNEIGSIWLWDSNHYQEVTDNILVLGSGYWLYSYSEEQFYLELSE